MYIKSNIGPLMQPWITQPGYPFVIVSSIVGGQNEVMLNQSQYIDIFRSNIGNNSVPMFG